MNFVLDIETIPRDLRAEPRKIQEYVWERAVRRSAEIGPGVLLDDYLAGAEGEALPWEPRRYAVDADGSIVVHAEETLGHYAEWLELLCRRAPFQWFNFFDYWPEPRRDA